MNEPRLVEHFFRHEYGRLVATLAGRVGVAHLEAVEDAVQSALLSAVDHWKIDGPPENPSAWLFRVAHNALMGELRQRTHQRRLLERHPAELGATTPDPSAVFLQGEVPDDLLRMLFVCCDDALPVASQQVLALKTLCGFSVGEIARRLFTTDANVYKRLARARSSLQVDAPHRFEPNGERVRERLPAVHQVLYQLFTEGYLSSHAEFAIRRELCDDAVRLATLLAEHPAGQVPETHALIALMHLHRARLTSRQDGSGGLLLLEEQDRSRWSPHEIHVGLQWLARSAEGDGLSRFHVEAGIAAEHCLAPSFAETRWDKVVSGYQLLEQITPPGLPRLNRALATAESRGPEAGLAVLDGFEPPAWLKESHLWDAVASDLHYRCGNPERADQHRARALDAAPTEAIQELLARRLAPRTGR